MLFTKCIQPNSIKSTLFYPTRNICVYHGIYIIQHKRLCAGRMTKSQSQQIQKKISNDISLRSPNKIFPMNVRNYYSTKYSDTLCTFKQIIFALLNIKLIVYTFSQYQYPAELDYINIWKRGCRSCSKINLIKCNLHFKMM